MTGNFTPIRKCINCWGIGLPLDPAYQNRAPATSVAFSTQQDSIPFPRLGPFIFLLDNRKSSHIMARVPQSKTTDSPYKVQVLDRALAALAILAKSSSDCSLAELCPALKLHKSTVHRLMMVLEQHRLVVKNPDTGRYRLGLRLYEVGSRAVEWAQLP